MTEDMEVHAVCWNRFRTQDLTIEPALVGEFHEFILYRDSYSYRVRVELPAGEAVRSTEAGRKPSRLSYSGWRVVDGKEKPSYLWVSDVDVVIYLPRPVEVPAQILEEPPNQYDIVSEGRQESLNRLAGTYREIAEEVFDLWIRTLRWKSGNAGLGQPSIIGAETGWSSYLEEASTRKPFWALSRPLHAKHSEPITITVWQSAQRSLSENQPPPTHFDLMFNAQEHIRRGNLRLAVIDLAVACEVYMRGEVDQALPDSYLESLRKLVWEVNISQVYSHIFPDLLDEESDYEFRKIKGDLERLYADRNGIMHTGDSEDLTVEKCERYLEASQSLFSLGGS